MFNTKTLLQHLKLLREKSPLVHCMTNDVVTNFTANVLLGIGASPAMVVSEKESADFATLASSLLINIGTITEQQANAMLKAVAAAKSNQVPWTLDPVAYSVLKFRSGICEQLIEYSPTVIRGNASEIYSLAGFKGDSKGADSTMSSADAIDATVSLANKYNCVVAVTGKDDYVTDGKTVYKLSNGSSLLTLVTGTGCSLSAMVSAYLAICNSPLESTLTAISHLNIASEIAHENTHGIGSFAISLLDNLYLLSSLEPEVGRLKCQII